MHHLELVIILIYFLMCVALNLLKKKERMIILATREELFTSTMWLGHGGDGITSRQFEVR